MNVDIKPNKEDPNHHDIWCGDDLWPAFSLTLEEMAALEATLKEYRESEEKES